MECALPEKSNSFLSSLGPAELALLSPHLRQVDLAQAKVLFEESDRVESLHFPITGIVSFIVVMSDGNWVEAGMIGRTASLAAPSHWTVPERSTEPSCRLLARHWPLIWT
jgi:CRP-like cAMP-binding protein